jgi:hypothetical protein
LDQGLHVRPLGAMTSCRSRRSASTVCSNRPRGRRNTTRTHQCNIYGPHPIANEVPTAKTTTYSKESSPPGAEESTTKAIIVGGQGHTRQRVKLPLLAANTQTPCKDKRYLSIDREEAFTNRLDANGFIHLWEPQKVAD